MAKKIRVGDTVKVIAGASRGQTSKVVQIVKDRVFLDEVNMKTKHVKRMQDQPGRLEKVAASIHISNVAHTDENGKPCRAGFILKTEDGKSRKFLGLKTGSIVNGKREMKEMRKV